MKHITNGKILIFIGAMHTLLAITPFAFGKQFADFYGSFFFKISEGLTEFPLLNGIMNYENFAAFWFFYFGLLILPIGVLVNHVEKVNGQIPKSFIYLYLMVVLIGVYMIPFSGMTFIMLPHALYMLIQQRRVGASK
ncbi:hypothetical protein KFE98_10565 [bacterium SCSIO 12741]|nr:hypothetical protein KFE98_10565 [bacterium SCSIO 12741]